mmetsp:Transcript_75123/g.140101  ORF Transcript_75123/g.140101 Transcript_75123/m.140101 type:complete len:197 (-) Transcript_75123:241-831(-)
MGSVQCCCGETDGMSMTDMATPITVDENTKSKDKQVEVADQGMDETSESVIPKAEPALVSREPMSDLPEPESAPPPKEDTSSYVQAPEPIKEEPPVQPSDDSFLVVVDNEPGVRLGFGIGHVAGQDALHIVRVASEGKIPEWNKANPARQVTEGCSILEINGVKVVSKSEQDMLQEISQACKQPQLKLLLAPEAKK